MAYFVVTGCNDSARELAKIKTVLKRIGADEVLLNTLDRPGTEAWVQPVGSDRLKKISDFLDGADIVRYESARSDMVTGHDDLMARLVSTWL